MTITEQLFALKGLQSLSTIAPILSINYTTIFRWAKSGYMPAYKLGGGWKVDPVLLVQWLAERDSRSRLSSGERSRYRRGKGSGEQIGGRYAH